MGGFATQDDKSENFFLRFSPGDSFRGLLRRRLCQKTISGFSDIVNDIDDVATYGRGRNGSQVFYHGKPEAKKKEQIPTLEGIGF